MERRYEKHDTAAMAQTCYTKEEWEAAYKFSIARNPWDRLVSWWAHIATSQIATAAQTSHIATSHIATYGISQKVQSCSCSGNVALASYQSAKGSSGGALQPEAEVSSDPSIGDPAYHCSFSHFFENCVSKHNIKVGNETVRDWWNDGIEEGIALISQLEYLVDNSSRVAKATWLDPAHSLVDFVGRTENLTLHFEEAMVAAGVHVHVCGCMGAVDLIHLT